MAEYQPEEIARLEKLYSSNPDGRVFTHLAEAYRQSGDLGRARQILEQGLRRHEGYASAHVVLGRVLMGQGESEAAAREFRRVLDLDPENRIALQSLAEYAQRRGQPETALEHLRRLAQLDPGDTGVQETIERLEREVRAGRQDAGSFHDPFAPRGPVYDEPAVSGFGPTPAFQPLDHLFGPDLGMPAEANETSDDPFAPADAHRSDRPAPERTAEQGEHGAGALPAAGPPLDEGWPPLDATEAPALRFDWGITPDEPELESADATGDAANRGTPERGAAEWLSSINADWDAPGGLGFSVDAVASAAARSGDAHAVDDEPNGGPAAPGQASTPSHVDYPADPIDGGELLPDAAETEVYTETLAELYRAQGFPERAIGVYRSLLSDRPGDPRLMQKLREMEGVLDTAGPTPAPADERAADQWAEVADAMERGAQPPGAAGAPDAFAGAHAEAADDEASGAASAAADEPAEDDAESEGERWLERVEAAWTGATGVTGAQDTDSPYTWAQERARTGSDEGTGQSIGALLGTLLAWRPTRGAEGEPEEELLLLDEVAEDGAAAAPRLEGFADDTVIEADTTAPGTDRGASAEFTGDAAVGDGMPGLDERELADWGGDAALGDGMPGLDAVELGDAAGARAERAPQRSEEEPPEAERVPQRSEEPAEAERAPQGDAEPPPPAESYEPAADSRAADFGASQPPAEPDSRGGEADLLMPWETASPDGEDREEAGGWTPYGEADSAARAGADAEAQPRDDRSDADSESYVPMPWEVDEPAEPDPWEEARATAWPASAPPEGSDTDAELAGSAGPAGSTGGGSAPDAPAGAGPTGGASVPEAPAGAGSAAASGSSRRAAEGASDEDDDLEMFRSWLQSLKK